MHVFPVILSGGAGTRLWPLSRSRYPKQFLPDLLDSGESLFQATIRRLPADSAFAPPLIICNEDHRFLVRDELERTGIDAHRVVLEPAGRNTAPAVTVAALLAMEASPDAILVVQPSDQYIPEAEIFRETARQAATIVREGWLALLGIQPRTPHTGYGYIRRGPRLPGHEVEVHLVEAFREKPDEETARQYLAEGNHYWNSGVFILPARLLLEEMERLQPDILQACQKAVRNGRYDLGFLRLDKDAFLQAQDISLDYAVMEHTDKAVVLPLPVKWHDLGSWQALWDMAPKDEHLNSHGGRGMPLLQNARGCYVHSSNKQLVALMDVEDLVVVETTDALLVAKKKSSEKVGQLVQQLRRQQRSECVQHVREHRPWGWFEPLNEGPRYKVKMLYIKPGARLSMQMHYHRSEHWVVVHGTAKVTIDGKVTFLCENESVFISPTQWHRLENPGKEPLQIIEVQIGSYLGEDDIVRTDDDYNRTTESIAEDN